MEHNHSLRNGLLVLESFTPRKRNLSLSDISKLNNLSKASVFRILKTLSELEYLKYRPEDKKYSLGPKVLSLGFSVLQTMEVREIARPYLEELSNECQKTVNLGVLDGYEMVYIDRIRFPDLRELNIRVGSRIPLYNSALGRAVLAHQAKEKLAELLWKFRKDPHAVDYVGNNGGKLLKALEKVRKEGFASSDEEFAAGIRAIAVPLFSFTGAVAYSINIVGSSDVIPMEELKTSYVPKLINIGREISRMLGHQATQ